MSLRRGDIVRYENNNPQCVPANRHNGSIGVIISDALRSSLEPSVSLVEVRWIACVRTPGLDDMHGYNVDILVKIGECECEP